MYANDNNGYLPQDGDNTSIPTWAGGCPNGKPFPLAPAGGSRTTYDTYYPQQVAAFRSIGYPRNYACLFSPYLKNEKLLRCPADVPNSSMYQRSVYLTSYVMNWSVDCNAQWTWINGIHQPGTWKLSQFKGDTILLWENDELRPMVFGQWDNFASAPDGGVSGRHGNGATVGNMDGTVERMSIADFYWMAAGTRSKFTGTPGQGMNGGQPLPNRLWCCPTTSNGAP